MTCRPRPRPSAAPSMIPGKSLSYQENAKTISSGDKSMGSTIWNVHCVKIDGPTHHRRRTRTRTTATYNTWIRAPRYFIVPGIQVNVVNSYAAASLFVPVKEVNKVDFPTLGKPTNPIRVSPDLVTIYVYIYIYTFVLGMKNDFFLFGWCERMMRRFLCSYAWINPAEKKHSNDQWITKNGRTIKSTSSIFGSSGFPTRTIDQFWFQFTNFGLQCAQLLVDQVYVCLRKTERGSFHGRSFWRCQWCWGNSVCHI